MGFCSIKRIGRIVYCEDLSWRAPVFRDRFEAGEQLASLLEELGYRNVIVFGLAAGGVPVAYSVARKLRAVMDVIVVKKILYPWTTEAGFGAVAPDKSYEYSTDAVSWLGYDERTIEELVDKTYEVVRRRMELYRGTIEVKLHGETAVVVDDGIATGYTMSVAVWFLERHGASRVIAAAPTASTDGAMMVSNRAGQVVTINVRGSPYAVADAYLEWHDVSDEEVIELLEKARKEGLYKVHR